MHTQRHIRVYLLSPGVSRTSTSASSWLASTSCQFWKVPPKKTSPGPRITSQYHPILRRHCRQGCNLSAFWHFYCFTWRGLLVMSISSISCIYIYIYHVDTLIGITGKVWVSSILKNVDCLYLQIDRTDRNMSESMWIQCLISRLWINSKGQGGATVCREKSCLSWAP